MSEHLALVLSAREYARLIPRPALDANKYSRGTVGVLGGCAAYPGAPVLAAQAAARCGAGYVRIVTTQDAAHAARVHVLSIPVTGCAQGAEGTFCKASMPQAKEALAKSKVIVAGPGMGACADTQAFLAGFEQEVPWVIDADALNIVAKNPELLTQRRKHPRILTPHEGEAARLLGRPVQNRAEDALLLAERFAAVVLLKGPRTLVASPAGELREIAEGGVELAKAGTGDVLSGIIGAFLCQGLDAFEAACLAVFVHARAARHAAREISIHAVMPEDIISAIGPTLVSLEAESFS